jgi:hypothetical protein
VFPCSWCICGGWAIDLFVNRVSRSHKDIELAIWRTDQLALRSYLAPQGWTFEKAVQGELLPWADSEWLDLPIHEIHGKNPNTPLDRIEILLNEVWNNQFLFRRELSITHSLDTAIVESELGIPILAPEIVLLYKPSFVTL